MGRFKAYMETAKALFEAAKFVEFAKGPNDEGTFVVRELVPGGIGQQGTYKDLGTFTPSNPGQFPNMLKAINDALAKQNMSLDDFAVDNKTADFTVFDNGTVRITDTTERPTLPQKQQPLAVSKQAISNQATTKQAEKNITANTVNTPGPQPTQP
jgi:hypothetical protein